ncbi:macrophage activating glycoprotein [Pleurotus pulmonarius]
MAAVFLNALVISGALAVAAQERFPKTPLVSKHFSYPSGLPYQADDEDLLRGTQFGYNRCNSSTENQQSLCQTSFLNGLDDFCLWGPSKPNSLIADTEGEEVAWCTKPGRGTRIIPADALKGVQFMRTPDYVQVVGFIDQTAINIARGDSGGELDPHGADLRGNPLGGLMYSNAWSDSFEQAIEWHNFMGGDAFCLKVCDPSRPNAANYCQHIYDRIGCAYNAPNNAKEGVFESCEGENQDFPGVYTQDGRVLTYTQPPEALGVITSVPYQPRVPASSNCKQFSSSALYTNAPGSVAPMSLAATSSTASPSSTSKSGGSQSQTDGESNDATYVVFSAITSILGVLFSALFLA